MSLDGLVKYRGEAVERPIDQMVTELKDLLLEMGGYVEKSINHACKGLIQRKPGQFDQVYDIEKRIDEHHMQVDDRCLRILAQQSPVANDLRLILSMIKINVDLERMGDLACNIAYHGQDYTKQAPIYLVENLDQMALQVRQMVKAALDAFVRKDTVLAERVLNDDDSVDRLKRDFSRQLVELIKEDPTKVDGAIDLLIVVRCLERIGDHATNIAEDIIFAVTGNDVRHGQPKENPNGPILVQ